jgi:hypothetical protein
MGRGRPRLRDEDIAHGTRRGYQQCRAGADGNPCDRCKDANADYAAANRAKNLGLHPPQPTVTVLKPSSKSPPAPVRAAPEAPVRPGPVERGVVAACAALAAAHRMPDLVEAAKTLAADLDDPRRWSCHASAQRQLMATMARLREASAIGRQGRLAQVAQLTQRRGGV